MSRPPAGSRQKSRIVIDVEQARAQQPQKSKGRGRNILGMSAIVLGVLLLLLLGIGYAWWQNYKQGPSYTMALLVDAAQREDVKAVEELIDSDRIAEGFVPQVADKLSGGAGGAVRQQIEAALPQVKPRVRETMREEVAGAMKGLAEKTGGRVPFIVTALGISRFADVKREGDAAATAAFQVQDRTTELMLERRENRWKVVTVKDDAMASGIAARIASSLPTTGAGSPPPPGPSRRRPGR